MSRGAALRPMQVTQGMPIGNPTLRSDHRYFSVNALVFGLKTVANFQGIDRACIAGRPAITLLYNS